MPERNRILFVIPEFNTGMDDLVDRIEDGKEGPLPDFEDQLTADLIYDLNKNHGIRPKVSMQWHPGMRQDHATRTLSVRIPDDIDVSNEISRFVEEIEV